MSEQATAASPSVEKTLRMLFLTVFLRGQSSRGLTKDRAPASVVSRLRGILLLYASVGLTGLFWIGNTTFTIALMNHGLTFMMLGMFVATAAGDTLFNKEESEILMHRPVTSKMLLRAKAYVLTQVSIYMAIALALGTLFVGLTASDGTLLFPVAHIGSILVEGIFSTSIVVLTYQLCLKWLGRERLDGAMTTLQVIVMVAFTLGSQVVPRLAMRPKAGHLSLDVTAWWVRLLPPAWFASIDDALAGTHNGMSWLLSAVGIGSTALVAWLAFGKLAQVYESGWQRLNEAVTSPRQAKSKFRLADAVADAAPFRWFLRDSVSRASFKLVWAYLARDRQTKLRVYPGITPMVIMPVVMLVLGFSSGSPGSHRLTTGFGGFSVAFCSVYVGLAPMMVLNLIKHSEQWRAAEMFMAAPIAGPAALLKGLRVAVVALFCVPLYAFMAIVTAATQPPEMLALLLPGIVLLPALLRIPGILGNPAPFSNPIEEAKSTRNMPLTMLAMFGDMAVGGVASAAWAMGFFWYFLAAEALAVAGICWILGTLAQGKTWTIRD